MGLKEYKRKRDFKITPEPAGTGSKRNPAGTGSKRKPAGTASKRKPAAADSKKKPAPGTRKLAFVVQKHRATALHYDFRLEWKGVMLSWAVPKGPSLDPAVKRMAMPTEDHPIEYNRFEGVIPEGQYGGGTVMIWDAGTWEPEQDDPGAALKKGDLKFTLHGKKLTGSWVLVRLKPRSSESRAAWLLIKHRDAHASDEDIAETKPRSVVSKRILAEIARDEGGDIKKAATGDPPAEIKKLLKEKDPLRRKTRGRRAVWNSNRP